VLREKLTIFPISPKSNFHQFIPKRVGVEGQGITTAKRLFRRKAGFLHLRDLIQRTFP
jgi:hypothetical protein